MTVRAEFATSLFLFRYNHLYTIPLIYIPGIRKGITDTAQHTHYSSLDDIRSERELWRADTQEEQQVDRAEVRVTGGTRLISR